MSHHLDAMVRSHRDHRDNRGRRPAGITSVCSAHPLVIEAAVAGRAVADGTAVLIEATSNQVDQFGGYTGLRPADFRRLVEEIATRVGFATEDLVLGRRPPRPAPVARTTRRPPWRTPRT